VIPEAGIAIPEAGIVPDAPAVEASLAAPTTYDIDVPLNTRVLSFVRLLSGRLKGFLEEGLSRGVEFLPMVQDVFRAEGLPLDLAYVPLIESAFKPTALSRAKARGIWQFMRGTGLENGLSHDWYIDERADPEKATRAAAKYLKTLYQTFDGDWHLALASYNGGPGRVQRALRRSGREDFWGISASTRFLPRETRDYVPLVLAAIIIARNPAEYGLSVRPVEQRPFETVTLPAALDLRRLSGWIGTPVEEIKRLNPELRQWTTPLGVANYALKVPGGTADIVRAHLELSDPSSLAALDRHTVRKGDTLTSVAKKLRVTRAELAEANGLSTRARLQPGQQLIVPRAPALPDGVTVVQAVTPDTPAPAVVRASAETNDAPRPAPRVHRVRRGDTLFSVARLYRTTVESLKAWNRLRSDTIKVGQRLTIRAAAAAATATN
jgi:membrane-bound lytic murein transglycosylase D